MNGTNASVLVVDDTLENLKVLAELLKAEGYRVRSALGGAIALRSIAAEEPDLVLLDIRMPEMDGFAVCRAIAEMRRKGEASEFPIIFISALDDIQDKVAAFGAGGVDYIVKPFQAEEVKARVGAHIELVQSRRALEARNRELAEALERLTGAELRLLRQEKMAAFGQLAAKIAHEINNPLGFIQSNMGSMERYFGVLAEAAARGDSGAEPDARAAKNIDTALKDFKPLMEETVAGLVRIRNTVRNLVAFADAPRRPALTDINEAVRNPIDLMREEVSLKAELTEAYGDLPRTVADKSQLSLAVMSLLEHALASFSDRGRISVTTSESGGTILVRFSHNGSFPDRDALSRLFSSEYRVECSDCPAELGLRIAVDAVRGSGGELSADFPEAGGAVYTLTIPLS